MKKSWIDTTKEVFDDMRQRTSVIVSQADDTARNIPFAHEVYALLEDYFLPSIVGRLEGIYLTFEMLFPTADLKKACEEAGYIFFPVDNHFCVRKFYLNDRNEENYYQVFLYSGV